MKTYVPFHPAHPGTYVFRVAPRFILWFILVLFTSCKTSRKSVDIQVEHQHAESHERTSEERSIYTILDSLEIYTAFSADSIVVHLELPPADSSVQVTKPSKNRKGCSSLVIYGINASSQATRKTTAQQSTTTTDSASRFQHWSGSKTVDSKEERHPPNDGRHMIPWCLCVLAFILFLLWRAKR